MKSRAMAPGSVWRRQTQRTRRGGPGAGSSGSQGRRPGRGALAPEPGWSGGRGGREAGRPRGRGPGRGGANLGRKSLRLQRERAAGRRVRVTRGCGVTGEAGTDRGSALQTRLSIGGHPCFPHGCGVHENKQSTMKRRLSSSSGPSRLSPRVLGSQACAPRPAGRPPWCRGGHRARTHARRARFLAQRSPAAPRCAPFLAPAHFQDPRSEWVSPGAAAGRRESPCARARACACA